jgi:hypothetical protein
MSIFATPDVNIDESGVKVLFLHGLEGSPEGVKATHLRQHWNASVPVLRTHDLRALRENHPGSQWGDIPKEEIADALAQAYADACAAVAYLEPDIIVGSSMGGALLAKLVDESKYTGPVVFLAPAINELVKDIAAAKKKDAVWVLGELDDVISNSNCVQRCLLSGGSLLVSIGDDHRLAKTVKTGLIDCAIITAIQLGDRVVP